MDGARLNAKWHRELLLNDPADLPRIAELVPGEVETVLVPDLTHLLRRDEEPPSLSRYKKLVRRPVDADTMRIVAEWVVATVGRRTNGAPSVTDAA